MLDFHVVQFVVDGFVQEGAFFIVGRQSWANFAELVDSFEPAFLVGAFFLHGGGFFFEAGLGRGYFFLF